MYTMQALGYKSYSLYVHNGTFKLKSLAQLALKCCCVNYHLLAVKSQVWVGLTLHLLLR